MTHENHYNIFVCNNNFIVSLVNFYSNYILKMALKLCWISYEFGISEGVTIVLVSKINCFDMFLPEKVYLIFFFFFFIFYQWCEMVMNKDQFIKMYSGATTF